MTRKLQDLDHFTNEDVSTAIVRNNPDELELVSITLALVSTDLPFAQNICTVLSTHEDNKVRAHALASLGHLARRFRTLNEQAVRPIIEAALHDADRYVREYAHSAADEIQQFLHWHIVGHTYGNPCC